LNAKQTREGKVDFDTVLKLGASLPGVTASSDARGIALKLKGRLVACTAINPSADPNSLMVCIDFPARDVLLERRPDVYYMTSHYRGYASVLVRLANVGRSELRNLLDQAVQFVGTRQRRKTAKKAAKEPAKAIAKKTAKLAAQRKPRRS
jgi:hypothetical protein